MNHKKKSTLAILGCIYPGAAAVVLVDNRILDASLVGVTAACFVWMMTLYVKGDPELQARQKRELRTQRIRELEEELDMKPMELWSDEDPEIVGRPEKGEGPK